MSMGCVELHALNLALSHVPTAGGNGSGLATEATPYSKLESITCDLSKFPDIEFFRVEVGGHEVSVCVWYVSELEASQRSMTYLNLNMLDDCGVEDAHPHFPNPSNADAGHHSSLET